MLGDAEVVERHREQEGVAGEHGVCLGAGEFSSGALLGRALRLRQPTAAHGPQVACEALTAAFSLLGKRWNGLIIGTLAEDAVGFTELRRRVGAVTDSVLSDRLSELAAAGLVERVVTDARPPGVTYRLTASGRGLLPVLADMATWARHSLPERCAAAAAKLPD